MNNIMPGIENSSIGIVCCIVGHKLYLFAGRKLFQMTIIIIQYVIICM